MNDSTDRNTVAAITALLGAGAIVTAGGAGQFDGPLYSMAVAAGALLGVGALAGLYRLRYS